MLYKENRFRDPVTVLVLVIRESKPGIVVLKEKCHRKVIGESALEVVVEVSTLRIV